MGVWIGGVWTGHFPESEKYFSEAEFSRKIHEIPQKELFSPNFRLRNLKIQSPKKCNSIPPPAQPFHTPTRLPPILKHVQSDSVPSRLLLNSCLLNPGRGPKSNRTSRVFPVVLSKGKAPQNLYEPGFSKLTRFRNTENLVNPLCLDMDVVKTLSTKGSIEPRLWFWRPFHSGFMEPLRGANGGSIEPFGVR